MNAPSTPAAFRRLEGRINWERRDRTSGWQAGLNPIRALLAVLGHPEKELRIVHVAGSKGKGSVCSLVTYALCQAGHRVGTYGSPHVDSITERVRIDGHNISEADLAGALEIVLDAVEAGEDRGKSAGHASWFDIMTAAALVAFKAAGVDFVVLEVGLGGRLDSTNAIPPPEVAVVTTIALEHTEVLGSTHGAIAREKGGIVKPGCDFVSGCDPESEAGIVLAEVARSTEARRHRVAFDASDQTFDDANLRVAREVLEALRDRGVANAALASEAADAARLPGRMEPRELDGVQVVLDGAHVPESLERALAQTTRGRSGPLAVVLAVHREKDVEALLAPIAESIAGAGATRLFATTVPGSG
ncbi:MAG: Mur ligase family protein, partial [Planctomycetota bacterium]